MSWAAWGPSSHTEEVGKGVEGRDCMNVNSSTIHDSKNVETTQVLIR